MIAYAVHDHHSPKLKQMTFQVSANAAHCYVFYVTRVDCVCPVRKITSLAYCSIAG